MFKTRSQLPVPYAQAGRRPELPAGEPRRLKAAISGPVRIGWVLIFTFAAGFGSWAGTAPLAAGAIAQGIISPDGNRRIVQHLEGGVVASILVRDGDYATKGQPVVILENVMASATYQMVLAQYRTALATHARLSAELLGQETVSFPDELKAADDLAIKAIIDGQRSIFASRRDLALAQKQVLGERIQQMDEQTVSLIAQVESAKQQLALLDDEIGTKKKLLADGLVTKPVLLALQRLAAELTGRLGDYRGNIAEVEQKRSEIKSQMLSADAERVDTITRDLDAARVELASALERLNASKDVLNRTIVVAPITGRVVNLRFHSPGGVVGTGEPILEIVPSEEELMIDARVAVNDIDIVHIGMPATVHLSALASYRLPRIEGVVRSVSADRLTDERTGQSYYLAKVEVPHDVLAKLGKDVELVPGMPAEVLIISAERTMIQYLLEPFYEAFRHSFREA